MKLIKIKTKGFKSFANKIELNFDGGVVGIVGPNGSGKSNINDAIKWVLGEQSIKSLRADNSDEVIFSGSKMVQASNEAQVSLTFDNSAKLIDLPYEKIIITRILKRGESSNKYYINNNEARLKDIKTIAMESGIGKSSLAIISQGTISDIAEATPEQRRGIFEEAAGTSKYKARKKEALRKLDSTTDALEKIKTIRNELEKQVKPLRRQAEKAKIYLEKKDALKEVEISLILQDVDFFSKKLKTLNEELEGVKESKISLESNMTELEHQIKEKNTYKLKVDNEIVSLSSQYQDISNRLRDVEINESRASERRDMIINGEIIANKNVQANALKEELDSLLNKVNKYKIWEEKSSTDIVERKTHIISINSNISKLNFDIESNRSKLMKLRTQLAILKEYAEKKTNLYRGVRVIVENKGIFSGFKGMVADLIKAKEGYETAIDSILTSSLQHILVDTSETAVKAINFLKANKSGRATFIPLTSIRPKGLISEHEMLVKSFPGFLGKASELVDTQVQYQIVAKFLLGNIIIVDTIENATKITKTFQNRYMVVSLEGDIVRAGGVISGGQRNKTSELVNGEKQMEKIKIVIPQLEETIQKQINEKNVLNNSISEDQSIIAELNIETAKVREKKTISQSQFNNLKIVYEQNTNSKFIEKDDVVLDSHASLNEERMSIQTLLKAKRESLINANNELAIATIQKNEFEKTLRHLLESSSEQTTQKNQAEFIINSSKNRLLEEYEMTLEAAYEVGAKTLNNIEKAREKVKIIRNEIKELGHVNLDAIEMFKEVNKRYLKFKESEEELFSAQQTIISAINKMDEIIISRLDQTVKEVNKEFNNVFTTMFGGGFAKVRYTNPSDLLETGIDVIAQPPGKTVKNLKLFSGGEKSMIAISLLFAILKARPLPLCILDEVEAALDDANVARYADYLQELKKQTQFIIITHRVGTMARLDYLFGATMQNRGVTSFFSVKLEEAKKLVD